MMNKNVLVSQFLKAIQDFLHPANLRLSPFEATLTVKSRLTQRGVRVNPERYDDRSDRIILQHLISESVQRLYAVQFCCYSKSKRFSTT